MGGKESKAGQGRPDLLLNILISQFPFLVLWFWVLAMWLGMGVGF